MPTSGKSLFTIPRKVAAQAERLGDTIAIREKAYGIWQAISWADYLGYVRKTALGMADLGLKRGERVALVLDNHPEWLFSQIGAQAAGCSTLSLFTSSIPDELAHALTRIEAAVVVVQNQEQVDKLLEVRDRLPFVRRVIYVDPTGMRTYEDPWLMRFSDVLARGEAYAKAQPKAFDDMLEKGKPEDVAIMIQTSGTTGISKVALLTHRSVLAMGEKWVKALHIRTDDRWLSMSPPAWILDQMWGFGVAVMAGMSMNFPETPETASEDFREIGPTLVIMASRFWEDMASRVRVKIADAGWIKRKLFQMTERIGRWRVDLTMQRRAVPLALSCLHRAAAWMVYRPLLDRLGCACLRHAYTGGHPISPDVICFFQAVGLNLKQCYGLTETGGIFQLQPDGEVKLETVGKTLPSIDVRISEEQEVLVQSDTLFTGYYRDFGATEGAFVDGWLRTGDAGYLDDDGHLVIIGRKEDIIRDKHGNAFSPDFIETRLKFSPYIKEAVIFGEGRPFLTALINIDMDNVGSWAEERLIPYTTYMDLTQQEAVEKLILGEMRRVNEQLSDAMKIRKCLLLYKLLDADDEELTRTGKVRRRFVYGVYLTLIEAMYRNQQAVDVKGKIRYRDGRVGEISTRVRILEI